MIKQLDALKVLEKYRSDSVVVTTMSTNRESYGWPAVSHNQKLDLPLGGAMGKASSIGLGMALAQPDRKILILDGDGSLLMNLGTLVTISNKTPKNLYHFVFENGVYAITGGQPVPGEGVFSFKGLAEAAGYATAYEFDDLEEFASGVGRILDQEGPVFVCLKIEPEIENTPIQFRPRARRTTIQALQELSRVLVK